MPKSGRPVEVCAARACTDVAKPSKARRGEAREGSSEWGIYALVEKLDMTLLVKGGIVVSKRKRCGSGEDSLARLTDSSAAMFDKRIGLTE